MRWPIYSMNTIRLWRVLMHYVEQAHAKSDWNAVRRIAVDETSARRGHRYVTNVLDAENSSLLLMVEGRSSEALGAFAKALVEHGGDPSQIEAVAMDMSPAYLKGAIEHSGRHTRLGHVGFINQGPVLVPEEPALFGFLTDLLVLTARTKNLRGLVIRPPDASKIDDRLWAGHQFLPNHLVELDSTTLYLSSPKGWRQSNAGCGRPFVKRSGNQNGGELGCARAESRISERFLHCWSQTAGGSRRSPDRQQKPKLLQDGMRFTQAIGSDSRLPNTKGKSSPVHFTYALVNESLIGGEWGLAPTADGIPTMR